LGTVLRPARVMAPKMVSDTIHAADQKSCAMKPINGRRQVRG
jgi:hypothetical protein